MQAAWYDHLGPAREVLVLGEIAKPAPRAGEVLVRVMASGINPSDYKRRGATASGSIRHTRMVPHSDGAGIVEAAGKGVDISWIGRRVWIWNAVYRHGYAAPNARELGTAAEYVVIPLQYVARLPENVDFGVGACLGVPAFTAYAAVFSDAPIGGKVILVQGGAGAVGELAVQFARNKGAVVVATVSSDLKAQRAIDAGAHHAINYREADVVSAVRRQFPAGVDQIIEVDFAANIRVDVELIKPYGVIVSYSSTSNPEPSVPYYALQY